MKEAPPQVPEDGSTPLENARQKALVYFEAYGRPVFSCDSGLYFDGLALTDSRQPGLNIRTPGRMPRLNDEEMIVYYSELIRSLGGKVLAYYLDGIAVYHNHRISSYMEDADARKDGAFYMIGRPSPRRQSGWPLDSLSLNRSTLTYFVDEEDEDEDEEITSADSKNRLTDFLVSSLSLHPLKN